MNLQLNKWLEILYYIDSYPGSNINDVRKRLGYTYSHTTNIIRLLKHNGLVLSVVSGRENILHSSVKGRIIADYTGRIIDSLGGNKNE